MRLTVRQLKRLILEEIDKTNLDMNLKKIQEFILLMCELLEEYSFDSGSLRKLPAIWVTNKLIGWFGSDEEKEELNRTVEQWEGLIDENLDAFCGEQIKIIDQIRSEEHLEEDLEFIREFLEEVDLSGIDSLIAKAKDKEKMSTLESMLFTVAVWELGIEIATAVLTLQSRKTSWMEKSKFERAAIVMILSQVISLVKTLKRILGFFDKG